MTRVSRHLVNSLLKWCLQLDEITSLEPLFYWEPESVVLVVVGVREGRDVVVKERCDTEELLYWGSGGDGVGGICSSGGKKFYTG